MKLKSPSVHDFQTGFVSNRQELPSGDTVQFLDTGPEGLLIGILG